MNKKTKQLLYIIIISSLLLSYYRCLPEPLFEVDYSQILKDKHNNLLSAHVSKDEQWRFPPCDTIPENIKQCLLAFEDEWFYYHPGFNPISLVRASYKNIKSNKITSGGSTLTMQLARMSRPKERTIQSKIIELIQATRLELKYSKDEILKLYLSHAPFGGNVVGIEAASWRYFGRPPEHLSWAEAATLAVLPNAPAIIHTGRNRNKLLKKRNNLLNKLLDNNILSDSLEYKLAIQEPLPTHPYTLPQLAPHTLNTFVTQREKSILRTTIQKQTQINANQIVNNHLIHLRQNNINNAAAIIVENKSGNVLAYVGNGNQPTKNKDVDLIQCKRSTGSILKPLLYAAALQDGIILPQTILPDIPTYFKNFAPQNFNRQFDGAVKADEALSRSLNIPAVKLLNDYGIERFHFLLQQCQFHSINRPPSYYGLSLILGGAEISLWDLAGCYSSMARTLSHYNTTLHYINNAFCSLNILEQELDSTVTNAPPVLSASSIYCTFKALCSVTRPQEEAGWENFAGSRQVAWKTGTSFGFRDAWAIGITPEYTIAVWVGNATGEGRPNIIGGKTAGPILFELFNMLPPTTWFKNPLNEMSEFQVCKESGFKASNNCATIDTIIAPSTGHQMTSCPYHHIIHLSKDRQLRVSSSCYSTSEMIHEKRFILPPVMESYYKNRHPEYTPLPPFMEGCQTSDSKVMEFIYPASNNAIFIPKDLNSELQRVIFKVAHNTPDAIIYWYLNDQYLGETQTTHHMEILPSKGWHTIGLVDNEGNQLSKKFFCKSNNE